MSAAIVPFLWYAEKVEEAVAFYLSIFPDARVTRTAVLESESPSGPPGSVKVIDFVLLGRSFTAMSAPSHDRFNHAISFVVECDTQDEIDRYWDALLRGGGITEACGWLKDRWGVSWQITPRALVTMMASPDRAASRRASDAMLRMVKLDLATLERAFGGSV